MLGAVNELNGVDLSEVREEVGSRSFDRGRTYARTQGVVAVDWDPSELALTGTVIGTAPYVTTAYFAEVDGGLACDGGECTCPVALVVAGVGSTPPPAMLEPQTRIYLQRACRSWVRCRVRKRPCAACGAGAAPRAARIQSHLRHLRLFRSGREISKLPFGDWSSLL
jgi:hypothetical protein